MHSRPALSNIAATSYTWLFKFKFIKYNENFSSSITLISFQMLSSNIWLVATVLDSSQHFTMDSAVLDIDLCVVEKRELTRTKMSYHRNSRSL